MSVNPEGIVGGSLRPGTLSVPDGYDPKAWKRAKMFEAQFVATMLGQGRSENGYLSSGGFSDGFASQMWQGMMDKAKAGSLARSTDLGIAKTVYKNTTNDAIAAQNTTSNGSRGHER